MKTVSDSAKNQPDSKRIDKKGKQNYFHKEKKNIRAFTLKDEAHIFEEKLVFLFLIFPRGFHYLPCLKK